MKYFLHYWLIAVPKLTMAQAFALFHKFVCYAAPEYVERGWYNSKGEEVDVKEGDDDYGDHCPVKTGEGHCPDPNCTTGVIHLGDKEQKGDDVV
jgi:hypothetical protein